MFFQVHAVVGVLSDDADPMVTVMKLEKAPQESYADIGGLDQQIQEIKVNLSVFYILVNTYILLDVLVCSIAVYFYESCSILASLKVESKCK